MPSSSSELTHDLHADTASPESLPELMEVTYGELRRMAGRYFRKERAGHTLQPTALIHEVFLRLADHGPLHYENRAHFFAFAARQMREILVDYGRHVRAQKRGGQWQKVALDDVQLVAPDIADFVALDHVLTRFEEVDPYLSRIVELHVFADLSWKEIATLLKRGESTVRKDWADAKAWLEAELEGQLP